MEGSVKPVFNYYLTAFTAGGSSDAEMATPTREPALPPSMARATPAPEGSAIRMPTHRLRSMPLERVKGHKSSNAQTNYMYIQ